MPGLHNSIEEKYFTIQQFGTPPATPCTRLGRGGEGVRRGNANVRSPPSKPRLKLLVCEAFSLNPWKVIKAHFSIRSTRLSQRTWSIKLTHTVYESYGIARERICMTDVMPV
ncbi:hypothetical protein EVAR_39326_1 [Eumeta japonica]|uniref:Uncharacterized protein n=1 Tax=Eumeta variegata TaxID=151549 RepID=A0A4C1WN33_EUMVA|nr:hypothetical protein EVAR_39326_1 [Eumeta japonica]